MESYKIPRHRVFISYHYCDEDKYYAEKLMNDFIEYDPTKSFQQSSVFEDCSVHEGDISDDLSNEEIRKTIRDDFIKDASVLIVLCGKDTKGRKYVDWEIHAAIFDTENNPKLGILVINLPSINQWIKAGNEEEKSILSNASGWSSSNSRVQLEERFPYLPSRIIDNMESAINSDDIIPITVVDWDRIENNMFAFKTLIDNAFKRSKTKTKHYNHSAPLRRNNS